MVSFAVIEETTGLVAYGAPYELSGGQTNFGLLGEGVDSTKFIVVQMETPAGNWIDTDVVFTAAEVKAAWWSANTRCRLAFRNDTGATVGWEHLIDEIWATPILNIKAV